MQRCGEASRRIDESLLLAIETSHQREVRIETRPAGIAAQALDRLRETPLLFARGEQPEGVVARHPAIIRSDSAEKTPASSIQGSGGGEAVVDAGRPVQRKINIWKESWGRE